MPGDGFRESGSSKERRLEPRITIGLLTDQAGFPLMVYAFEANMTETKTMLPVTEAFMAAHQLPDVTVVTDAGMISEANQKAIEAAGLSFILGMRIPHVPYVVARWRREHRARQEGSATGSDSPVPRLSNTMRRRPTASRRRKRACAGQVHAVSTLDTKPGMRIRSRVPSPRTW
jgi:hypothetical protein